MGEKTYPVTVEQLQGGIELLCPCMDDYLYVYDFKNDYYYISSRSTIKIDIKNNLDGTFCQCHNKRSKTK